MDPKLVEDMVQEFHRANFTMVVLTELKREHYGYTLRKALADHGMPIEAGTLYPILYRLESKKLVTSEWRKEDNRQRHFYKLTDEGRLFLQAYRSRIACERRYIDSLMEEPL